MTATQRPAQKTERHISDKAPLSPKMTLGFAITLLVVMVGNIGLSLNERHRMSVTLQEFRKDFSGFDVLKSEVKGIADDIREIRRKQDLFNGVEIRMEKFDALQQEVLRRLTIIEGR